MEQVKDSPVRCRSPHVCRRAEIGGCTSPYQPEEPTAAQQNLDRCARVLERERERMKEVWEGLKKEQKALTEVKEEMSKLMAKGTTDI